MTTLAHRISELLFDFDCIIVPELGGFITNYKPAFIDEHLDVFYPPSKSLGFNTSLKKNDGLLANYIAREEKISFENACESIKTEVEKCFEKLNEGKRVEFERVGILYMDSENKIHFDPDESINYLTSSFGLHKFYYPQKVLSNLRIEDKQTSVSPVESTPVIPIRPIKKEETTILSPALPTGTSKLKYWMAAILIPAIVYLGLVTWQSDFIKDGNLHQTDFNPFKRLKKKDYENRDSKKFVLKEVEIPPYVVPEKSELKSVTDETEHDDKIEANKPSLSESLYANEKISRLRFHVINGCFSIQKNAERQTQKLRDKGFAAHIIDKKGNLYRVSQGSFANRNEAISMLKEARQTQNKDSWLLLK